MWWKYLLALALARGDPSRPVRWPGVAVDQGRRVDEEEGERVDEDKGPVWGQRREGRQFGLFGLSNPFGILGRWDFD
jgi:hypothetical protein